MSRPLATSLSTLAPAGLALVLAVPAQAALTGFSDATVDPASYDTVILHTDPTVNLAIGATGAGNPGAGLSLTYTNTGGGVSLLSTVGFIYKGFSWNPGTDGALGSVDYSNDRYIDGGDDFINNNLVTSSRALLLQSGQYYLAAILDVGQPRKTWYTNGATGLDALDFVGFDPLTGLINASQHPDFSSAGGTLGFGFLNRFTLGVVAPYDLNALFAYDNIVVNVHADAQSVPLPGPVPLLSAALGAWLLVQRRTRSGQA